MSKSKIHTNNHIRSFLYRNEVPEKILESEFDYLPEEQTGFLQYKGVYYHTADFMRFDYCGAVNNTDYDGYIGTSAFSAIYIRLLDDDSYQIATVY